MKFTGIVSMCLFLGGAAFAATGTKPDYVTYHADHTVKTRGVYETDSLGRVIKFTVFDGAGKLLYTEIPYYSADGAIVRADHRDASGALQKFVVYLESKALVFDTDGKLIETQPLSPSDVSATNTK